MSQKIQKIKQSLRLKRKGNSYEIQDSPFYKVKSKNKLAHILLATLNEINQVKADSNYHVFALNTGAKKRFIQTPLGHLNKIHTRIALLLSCIKRPEYLHSGTKGKSHITNARAHFGNHPVLKMDIKSFYPSISQKSIFNFFYKSLCMSRDAAGLMAEICSYNEKLPTGSKVSMLLAYWTNTRLFNNLYSYCLQENLKITIYVDDLTFSGTGLSRSHQNKIREIILASGFKVSAKKTKLYAHNEPKLITGCIVIGNTLKLRNKHLKNIHLCLHEMIEATTIEGKEKYKRKLNGYINYARQIEPSFNLIF